MLKRKDLLGIWAKILIFNHWNGEIFFQPPIALQRNLSKLQQVIKYYLLGELQRNDNEYHFEYY